MHSKARKGAGPCETTPLHGYPAFIPWTRRTFQGLHQHIVTAVIVRRRSVHIRCSRRRRHVRRRLSRLLACGCSGVLVVAETLRTCLEGIALPHPCHKQSQFL